MNQILDCYKTLEVNFGARREVVASSYKRLCRQYHPDVSDFPDAEERMKQINLAYSFLCDKWSLEEKLRARDTGKKSAPRTSLQNIQSTAEARSVMEKYFRALMQRSNRQAYNLLSEHDRSYVTYASFCNWRTSVEKLFTIQSFTVGEYCAPERISLQEAGSVPSARCSVSITEKNLVNGKLYHGQFEKLAVFEHGAWHVYLGYNDLDTIARTFRDMLEGNLREEMKRSWEERRTENCDELGILSIKGFHKQAKRELYYYKRHRRPFMLGLFSIKIQSAAAEKQSDQILQTAAESLCSRLRETDIAAYAGNGAILVLFVEMKKKYAAIVIKRLAEAVRKDIKDTLNIPVGVEFVFSAYAGGSLERDVDELIRTAATAPNHGRSNQA